MIDKKNFRIALISLQQDAERLPPIGLVYIATYINNKLNIEKQNIRILDKNYCDIEKELAEYNPHIIGFTSMTVDYGKIIKFAKKLRPIYKCPFILGGVHISTLPQSLDKVFDIGIIGEGEETFAELIDLYIKKEKFEIKELKKIKSLIFYEKEKLEINTTRDPIKNLDDLPIPDFKFVNKEYFKRVEIPAISEKRIKCFLLSSRGCPYRCVFCSTARFWGKMRFHSPDFTARIVKKFIEDFDSDYIQVLDDLFTVSPQRVREIKQAFEKYGILKHIKGIECQPRANLMSEELCSIMKEMKIRVLSFGFESGSDKMLKWLKQESVTVETNKKAILLCEKYGFNTYGSLIYGSPTETIEDMEKTNEFIDFAIKHKVRHMWSFIATPFPATPYWEIASKRGKVSSNMDWDLLSHHNLEDPLMLDETVDKIKFKEVFLKGRKKLRKLKMKIIIDFLIKNPINVPLMIVKEPNYYMGRIIKQVFKQ